MSLRASRLCRVFDPGAFPFQASKFSPSRWCQPKSHVDSMYLYIFAYYVNNTVIQQYMPLFPVSLEQALSLFGCL